MNVLHMCQSREELLKEFFKFSQDLPAALAFMSDQTVKLENGDRHIFGSVDQPVNKWIGFELGQLVLHCSIPTALFEKLNVKIRQKK